MAKPRHHVGDKVKHPKGSGRVASVHRHETFYGIHSGGGIVYFPQSQVDPDHDGDNDTPGGTDTDHDAPAAASFAELLADYNDNR